LVKFKIDFYAEQIHVCKENCIIIIITFRYAGRFDCGCVYECIFSLLDEAKNLIADNVFEFRTNINQWEGREWHKVTIFSF